MRHLAHLLRQQLLVRQATAVLRLTPIPLQQLLLPPPLLLQPMGLLILQPQKRLMLQPDRVLPMPRSMLLLPVTRRRASMWPTRVAAWRPAQGMQPRLRGISPQCWPWPYCPQGEIPVTVPV